MGGSGIKYTVPVWREKYKGLIQMATVYCLGSQGSKMLTQKNGNCLGTTTKAS